MAQTALAEHYVRRASATSSLAQGLKGDEYEPLQAREEMLAAYGESGTPGPTSQQVVGPELLVGSSRTGTRRISSSCVLTCK